MNNKGIFCFLILLAFSAIQAEQFKGNRTQMLQLEKAKATAMEAEQLNAIKLSIEINTDKVVKQTIHEALLQNKEPEEIRDAVNQKLTQLFNATSEAYKTAKIEFKSTAGQLNTEFLNNNSKAIVSKIDKKTIAAEYVFTGGILKNQEAFAEITGKKTRQQFKIPIGYTIKATVAG